MLKAPAAVEPPSSVDSLRSGQRKPSGARANSPTQRHDDERHREEVDAHQLATAEPLPEDPPGDRVAEQELDQPE
jgi:hypothetical protein